MPWPWCTSHHGSGAHAGRGAGHALPRDAAAGPSRSALRCSAAARSLAPSCLRALPLGDLAASTSGPRRRLRKTLCSAPSPRGALCAGPARCSACTTPRSPSQAPPSWASIRRRVRRHQLAGGRAGRGGRLRRVGRAGLASPAPPRPTCQARWASTLRPGRAVVPRLGMWCHPCRRRVPALAPAHRPVRALIFCCPSPPPPSAVSGLVLHRSGAIPPPTPPTHSPPRRQV